MHQIFSLTPGTYIQYCTHWNYPLGNDRQWNYETLRVDVYYRRRPLRHRPPWRLNRPKRRRHRGPGRRSGRRWESNIIFDLIWFDLIWFGLFFCFFFQFQWTHCEFLWLREENKEKQKMKWNENGRGKGEIWRGMDINSKWFWERIVKLGHCEMLASDKYSRGMQSFCASRWRFFLNQNSSDIVCGEGGGLGWVVVERNDKITTKRKKKKKNSWFIATAVIIIAIETEFSQPALIWILIEKWSTWSNFNRPGRWNAITPSSVPV